MSCFGPYSPIPDYADVMTVADFREAVAWGVFTDDDGTGHPVVEDRMYPAVYVAPSRLDEIPPGITHVAWFNK